MNDDTDDATEVVDARLETARWTTQVFATLFLWLGLPLGALVLIHSVVHGFASVFLFAHACTVFTVGIAAILLRRRHDVLKHVMSGGLVLIAVSGAMHFGPNFGAALVFTAALMLATFFYGLSGAAVVICLALMSLLANAIFFREVTWSRPPPFPETTLGWVRLAASTVVVMVGVAYSFHSLLHRLHRAVASEAEAQSRERHAKRERENALQSYSTSQRLESVGRLAGGVSHDVNNALTIIRSGVDAIRDEALTADDRREILADIDSAARAAAATTQLLVAFSRGMPDDGGPASPHDVVDAVARSLIRLFPENIRVDARVTTCPRTTMAEGMMTQVLLNLALNARDACDGGGVVTLSCEPADDVVLLRCRDDGAGMSADTEQRIFEPFFTSKKTDGSGMGLPMVKAAVVQCGGSIAVTTALTEGTTFELRLPVAREIQPRAVAPVDVDDAVAGSHILLVEDQPQLLRAMSRELRRGGFSVTATGGLREAVGALEQGRFDLLCTDGILADGRAHDVIAALVALDLPPIPILVCSGYLPDELALEEFDDITFLRKPYAPGDLATTANTLLRRSSVPRR